MLLIVPGSGTSVGVEHFQTHESGDADMLFLHSNITNT